MRLSLAVLPWPHQEGGFGVLRARNTAGVSSVLTGERPGAVPACLTGGGQGAGEQSARGGC